MRRIVVIENSSLALREADMFLQLVESCQLALSGQEILGRIGESAGG